MCQHLATNSTCNTWHQKGNRPVVIASFLDPNEAHIFRGLLESEGIEAFVYHERSSTIMPITVSGIQVAVRAKDLEPARSLLEEIRSGGPAGGDS